MIHIIYGSKSDKKYFKIAIDYLITKKIDYKEFIISAHRDLKKLNAYIESVNKTKTVDVIIAVAGLAAALPGILAANTNIPVIGAPVPQPQLNGIDALLSILQSPAGAPVVSVGLHKKAPLNAVLFAEKILPK